MESVLDAYVSTVQSLEWVGASTNFVTVDDLFSIPVTSIASGIGMDIVLVKYMLAVYLCCPLALVMRFLPGSTLKNLFSFATGLLLVQWVFGSTWIHPMIASLFTYLICFLGPKKHNHKIVMIFQLSYIFLCHLYYQYNYYMGSNFDFTGTQMILVMKLSSFAYNVHDGREFAKARADGRALSKSEEALSKLAVTKFPSILEFFGYAFSFTSILAGPSFEFQEYNCTVDGSRMTAELEKSKKALKDKALTRSGEFVSALVAALLRLAVGTACLGAYMKLSATFPIARISDPELIAQYSWQYRMFYNFMALMGDQAKYASVWKIAEASCVLAGFGFQGVDERSGAVRGYRGVENLDILGFNFATNVAERSRCWNKGTQSWLERYIYRRTGNSLVATYFVSSMWHGMYPGYYMFFLSVPLLTSVERLVRAKINPLVIPGFDPRDPATTPRGPLAAAYYAVCWLLTLIVVFYIGQPFSQYSFENGYRVLASFYFVPYIACVAAYVVLTALPGAKRKEKTK